MAYKFFLSASNDKTSKELNNTLNLMIIMINHYKTKKIFIENIFVDAHIGNSDHNSVLFIFYNAKTSFRINYSRKCLLNFRILNFHLFRNKMR